MVHLWVDEIKGPIEMKDMTKEELIEALKQSQSILKESQRLHSHDINLLARIIRNEPL